MHLIEHLVGTCSGCWSLLPLLHATIVLASAPSETDETHRSAPESHAFSSTEHLVGMIQVLRLQWLQLSPLPSRMRNLEFVIALPLIGCTTAEFTLSGQGVSCSLAAHSCRPAAAARIAVVEEKTERKGRVGEWTTRTCRLTYVCPSACEEFGPQTEHLLIKCSIKCVRTMNIGRRKEMSNQHATSSLAAHVEGYGPVMNDLKSLWT